MTAKYDNVIIFGPTGAVGGSAALEASRRGAKVWLAMRDPSKHIQGVPADVEKAGNFARVRADLTDPASVTEAIKVSGAKAAYLYAIVEARDGMLGVLKALKDAGVEYIVFLSSASIKPGDDIRSITKENFIPYVHAQIEAKIEDLGFPYFTTLRPFHFASNLIKLIIDTSVKPPKTTFIWPDTLVDNIVPEDVGAVGGAVLVDRPSDKKETIYMYGPEVRTIEESWAIVKRVTGRDDIDTTPLSKDQFIEIFSKKVPDFLVSYFLKSEEEERHAEIWFPSSVHGPAVANIKKYSGREPTRFEDYIAAQKAEWQAL